MPRVTVLIPTAARPETLEMTLRGVERQTAVGEIAEVIVSENLSDERSREVCRKFPELPISYKLREPPLANMMRHAEVLFAEADSELVAFVCDDDIWSPGHLQSAIESLDRNPDSVAHFSGFISAESELSMSGAMWAPSLLWLAAGRPPKMSEYVYDQAMVLALAWIVTPFQWSTLVARTPVVAVAAPALTASPHFFYADRMLITALAEQGKIILDPAVDTLYRVYPGNWARGQSAEHLEELLAECEALVLSEAQRAGIDVPALWDGLLSDMTEDIVADVSDQLRARFSEHELAAYGFAGFLSALPPKPPISVRIKGRIRRAFRALLGKAD